MKKDGEYAPIAPRLILVGGLPGAGKTTLARRLAEETPAVFLCPDEQLANLDIDLTDSIRRQGMEKRLTHHATTLLSSKQNVILELALWRRQERVALRDMARRHGAGVELHFLEVPLRELAGRLALRNDHPAKGVGHVTTEQLYEWAGQVEKPTADELRSFDQPLSRV